MVSSRHQVPRQETWPTSLSLVSALLLLWVTSVASSSTMPFMEAQTTDLVLGSLLVVSGVHARNYPFLHAPSVRMTMPWAIDAARVWQRALVRQRRLLLVCLACTLSVFGTAVACLPSLRARMLWAAIQGVGLLTAAAAAEPLIAGLSSRWGRRFPEGHPLHAAQRQLSGGWTRAEAVVHLYAGAGALAMTVLVAMITQLLAIRAAHGTLRPLDPETSPDALLLAGAWVASPLLLAPVTAAAGRRLYTSSMRASTPWLHEAIKTLAGPPTPAAAPFWIRWIPSPTLRLWALQRARTTPLLTARLVAPSAWAAWAVTTYSGDNSPSARAWAVGLTLAGAWCSPVWQTLRRRGDASGVSLRALPSRIVHAGAPARVAVLAMALLPGLLPPFLVLLTRLAPALTPPP